MQIEQFDTGLKNQNNFQKLKITAEENKQNKQIVRNYLNNIYKLGLSNICLLYTSPSPRDCDRSRMPSSA